jgi:hypothetical protein
MIQEFLTNNLIQITDDEIVEKLIKASAVLEKKLSKNKSKITTFTLIAIDPEIKATDPNVLEVQELIINNWKTFTSNCKDIPLTYIRSVIFNALERISEDINIANQIWLTSKNIIKYLKLTGKEKELIFEFLFELGIRVEQEASESFGLSKNVVSTLNNNINNIISPTELKKELFAAAVSVNTTGGENSNYAGDDNSDEWAMFYSEKASKGITKVINNAFNKISLEINRSKELIQNSLTKQFHVQLLWWKEACYSKTLKDSYRITKNGLLQLILAIDYSSFVPFIFSQSADYFLKETHTGIISDEDKKLKLSEIFEFIDGSKEILKQYLNEGSFEIERVSLTQFVEGYIYGKYSIIQLKDLVGISDNIELTLSEFTLWLFHDLQVLNYSKSKK